MEDEDDEDKKNISLMGRKDGECGENSSPNKQAQGLNFMENNDFPEPIGSVKKVRKRDHQRLTDNDFFDQGHQIHAHAQAVKDSLPKPRGTLTLDPVCLSCTGV